MKTRLSGGFIAGALGAVILVAVMYIMKAMGMEDPGFVQMYRAKFGTYSPADHFIAAILFIICGGIWGIIFTLSVKHPTLLKGFLFGILPTLWLWIVVNAVMGKPLFNDFTFEGIIFPILFNMVIWGSFIGWYLSRNFRTVAIR